MGLFDFFSGGGGIKRTVAKANNKDAQSIDRWKALEQLRDDASEEAIAGLLRRFSFNYDKSIEDEQEKHWVHDTIVELGRVESEEGDSADDKAAAEEMRSRVLRALEQNLVGAESISWQLKILEHIASGDAAWSILEKVIQANDNEYIRDPSRKIQLIDFLGEYKEPRVSKSLLWYLEDPDETVRFHTVEALFHQKDEEAAREPLLQLLTKPEEDSRRIKIRILDGFADVGWNTHGFKGTVEKVCEELGRGHTIDNKGKIKKGAK